MNLLLKTLTVILAVMLPAGLVIMLTPFGTDFIWTTSIFLFLQAVILFIILYSLIGFLRTAIVTAVILLLSFFIEYIGVNTSYPFGSYTYQAILSPSYAGVPAAIAFAWYSVVVSSYFAVSSLFPGTGALAAGFIASVLILAVDIMLEPFASFINGFWVWDSGSIPLINFISWWILGLLFCLVLSLFVPPAKIRELNPSPRKIPYFIIIVNIINFLVINLVHGYILITLAGFSIIVLLTLIFPRFVKNES